MNSGLSFPAAPRAPRAASQAARGSLPPANSGGSYLRAFVAEQRPGWGSVPKAKSHSSVRSEPAGSALAERWRGAKEPLWDTCENESEFVKIVCVYTLNAWLGFGESLDYPTIRKVPAKRYLCAPNWRLTRLL